MFTRRTLLATVIVVMIGLPGTLQAEETNGPGDLALHSAEVTFSTKGKTFNATIAYPELRHWQLNKTKDAMQMYLRIIDDKNPGRLHWVHLSQLKTASFQWIKGKRPEANGKHPYGPAWRRSEPDQKTRVTAQLRNGKTIEGWFPDAFGLRGRGNKGRSGYDTSANKSGSETGMYLKSMTPTTFAILDSGKHPPAPDPRVEVARYNLLDMWRKSGVRGKKGQSFFTEKKITPRQASELYQKHRTATQRWQLTEHGKTTTVDLWKTNHRYTSSKSKSGSTILIGGSFVYSDYKPLGDWRSIQFSGKRERISSGKAEMALATITRSDGEKQQMKLPLWSGEKYDYVVMWRTDYGFAGVSILPLRKVSLIRSD